MRPEDERILNELVPDEQFSAGQGKVRLFICPQVHKGK
jgi:hypothetical protein